MNRESRVSPYAIRFGVVYALLILVLAAIWSALGIDSGSGVSMGALVAAAVYTAAKFVKDHKRVPSPGEKARLTWLSLLASWIVSIMLPVGYLMFVSGLKGLQQVAQGLSQLNPTIIVGVLLVVCLLYFTVLWFSYGWFAKTQFNGLVKKGNDLKTYWRSGNLSRR